METRVDVSKLDSSFNPEKSAQKKQNVEVLYIDISHCSPRSQFIVSCSAVFVLYILYGYLQELIFTQEGFKSYGWYLTLVQFTFYSIFAFIECVATKTKRRISLKVYVFLAALTLGTMGFSNSSLNYLNYPTQVIFKCCKLIPVMIGSILIQQKKYKFIDFCAALCMCIGLSLFTLADSQLSPNFNVIGVLMISSALVCDALIGNVQEKFMKSSGASNREVILYSYAIGHLYLTVVMLVTGNFWSGIVFCAEFSKMDSENLIKRGAQSGGQPSQASKRTSRLDSPLPSTSRVGTPMSSTPIPWRKIYIYSFILIITIYNKNVLCNLSRQIAWQTYYGFTSQSQYWPMWDSLLWFSTPHFTRPFIYWYALLFSVTGYLGVQVVLSLVRTCGALTAVTVTTSRKAVSIVVSFIFFAKPYSSQYFWAGSLVVIGIYLNLLSKNNNFNINYRKFSRLYDFIMHCLGRQRSKSVETTV